MKPYQAKAVARLVKYRVDNVANFREQIQRTIHEERRELERSAKKEQVEEKLEAIQDDLAVLDEMAETANQLAFVGLYSAIELRLKALLGPRISDPNDLGKVFRFKELAKLLKKEFKITINQLQGFQTINEIRLINNSVKHEGKVGEELANTFTSWKKGDPLSGLEPALALSAGLSPAALRYPTFHAWIRSGVIADSLAASTLATQLFWPPAR
jgi:hypothetical protein